MPGLNPGWMRRRIRCETRGKTPRRTLNRGELGFSPAELIEFVPESLHAIATHCFRIDGPSRVRKVSLQFDAPSVVRAVLVDAGHVWVDHHRVRSFIDDQHYVLDALL